MAFNLAEFVMSRNIPYADKGANVQRGFITIHCPLCGERDPGLHMGIALDGHFWGCWRDAAHRGRRPARLVQALLRCSWQEAVALCESDDVRLPPHEMKERALRLFSSAVSRRVPFTEARYPSSVHRIAPTGLYARFWAYLEAALPEGRGYGPDTEKVVRRYRLRAALSGPWAHRLLLPFTLDGVMVGWTGRAIGRAEIRYLTHPEGPQIKQTVFNYDRAARGGRALVICEGPFDALRVDWFGRKLGARSVALLGTTATAAQVSLLLELAYRFDAIMILLDADASSKALHLSSQLASIHAKTRLLPSGYKDPGELDPPALHGILQTFLGDDPR